MNPIQPILDHQGFVMLDGAMATELERRGADLNHTLWSARFVLDDPQIIEQLHYDYLEAGADVITTASYQATPQSAARVGLKEEDVVRLLQDSVTLATAARARWEARGTNGAGRHRPLVAAAIGPYATFLADGSEYTGDYDLNVEELKDFHRPRMAILDDSGADLFALETVPRRREAVALLELLREFPQRKAWLAFSCKDREHVSHGERFNECVALARGHEQIVAVGVNCSPPAIVEALLRQAGDPGMPLIAYPNSGERYHSPDNTWLPAREEDSELPELAVRWRAAGASLIGGCCRTTVEDIAATKASLLA